MLILSMNLSNGENVESSHIYHIVYVKYGRKYVVPLLTTRSKKNFYSNINKKSTTKLSYSTIIYFITVVIVVVAIKSREYF